MASILEDFDASLLAFQQIEPKRTFRWFVEIDGIDSFAAQTMGRPSVSFDEVEVNFVNSKQYFAGKATWQELNITFLDVIAPSQLQKLMAWMRSVQEFETGGAGYKLQYIKTITLKMLGPQNDIVEQWTLKNAWPKSLTPSTLDYNDNTGVSTLECTLRFDQAIQEY